MTKLDLRDFTVSDFTLAPEDLIAAFTRTLDILEPRRSAEIRVEMAGEGDIDTPEYLDELVERLAEALEGHAPDGYSFGAHWGDGALFGFWRVADDEDLAEYEASI